MKRRKIITVIISALLLLSPVEIFVEAKNTSSNEETKTVVNDEKADLIVEYGDTIKVSVRERMEYNNGDTSEWKYLGEETITVSRYFSFFRDKAISTDEFGNITEINVPGNKKRIKKAINGKKIGDVIYYDCTTLEFGPDYFWEMTIIDIMKNDIDSKIIDKSSAMVDILSKYCEAYDYVRSYSPVRGDIECPYSINKGYFWFLSEYNAVPVYSVIDINNDGYSELIIGAIANKKTRIFAIYGYNYNNKKPIKIYEPEGSSCMISNKGVLFERFYLYGDRTTFYKINKKNKLKKLFQIGEDFYGNGYYKGKKMISKKKYKQIQNKYKTPANTKMSELSWEALWYLDIGYMSFEGQRSWKYKHTGYSENYGAY